MGLSADDRLDILELPGRYAEALDTLQPDDLHTVFTDDAVWEVEGGRVRLKGPACQGKTTRPPLPNGSTPSSRSEPNQACCGPPLSGERAKLPISPPVSASKPANGMSS